MQSNLTYMLTSGGHAKFNMKLVSQHTSRARLLKLYKSDSSRACLTNGFARLRDDRARLREVCE